MRVCDMCMCLARDGVGGDGGDWMTGLGLGFIQTCLCVSVGPGLVSTLLAFMRTMSLKIIF